MRLATKGLWMGFEICPILSKFLVIPLRLGYAVGLAAESFGFGSTDLPAPINRSGPYCIDLKLLDLLATIDNSLTVDQLHQVTEAAPILLGMPACRKRDQVCFGTDTASRTPFEISCYRWNSQGGRNGQIQLPETLPNP